MVCSISDARIEFEVSGIEVAPYQVDFRLDQGKFDHARCEVSREAGELIANNAAANEPAQLKIGERTLRRLYLPMETGVEHGDKESFVTLMDPLHIMTQGVCDKYFEEVSLKDVMSYIMSHVVDPNGVLNTWDITDPNFSSSDKYGFWSNVITEGAFDEAEIKDSVTSDIRGELIVDEIADINARYTGGNELGADLIEGMFVWAARGINNMTGVFGEQGGFDFDQISPHEALKQVADEFELEYWVDDNRTLQIGTHKANPSVHILDPTPNTIAISEYNVTEAAYPVAEVTVKGGKARLKHSKTGEDGNVNYAPSTRGVKTWGQARIDGVENGRTISTDNKDLHTGESLKKAAENRLMNELAKNKSGNIVLNPSANGYTRYAQPHQLSVGDFVAVRNPPGSCSHFDADGGRFQINSVSHNIQGSEGWEITISVGYIPDEEIQSRFFYYKPESDEIVEEDSLYKQAEDLPNMTYSP